MDDREFMATIGAGQSDGLNAAELGTMIRRLIAGCSVLDSRLREAYLEAIAGR